MEIKEIIEKITLPIAIIIAAIILGIAFYTVQYNKQQSIEKQQLLKLQEDKEQQELKLKQEECNSLSSGVKKRWNNVMGVTYDDNKLWGECMVTYTDNETGEVKTSPLRLMQDAD